MFIVISQIPAVSPFRLDSRRFQSLSVSAAKPSAVASSLDWLMLLTHKPISVGCGRDAFKTTNRGCIARVCIFSLCVFFFVLADITRLALRDSDS